MLVGRCRFGGAVAVAVAMLVLVAGCGTDGSGDQPAGSGSLPAGVVPIDGFADREDPAVAAVGDRLFVFGGQVPPPTGRDTRVRYLNDGVLVDPASGDAEELPEPPFDRPLAHPVAQRLGGRILVLGTSCIASEPMEGNAEFCEPDTFAAATFDPGAREWSASSSHRSCARPAGTEGRSGCSTTGERCSSSVPRRPSGPTRPTADAGRRPRCR